MNSITAPNRDAANDPLAPWNVEEAAYPHSGPTWEKLSFCLNYAVLASSGHNSEPWRFKLGLDDVKLFADRTRALPVVELSSAKHSDCLASRRFSYVSATGPETKPTPRRDVRDVLV